MKSYQHWLSAITAIHYIGYHRPKSLSPRDPTFGHNLSHLTQVIVWQQFPLQTTEEAH